MSAQQKASRAFGRKKARLNYINEDFLFGEEPETKGYKAAVSRGRNRRADMAKAHKAQRDEQIADVGMMFA